jgi:hypothetical protein
MNTFGMSVYSSFVVNGTASNGRMVRGIRTEEVADYFKGLDLRFSRR